MKRFMVPLLAVAVVAALLLGCMPGAPVEPPTPPVEPPTPPAPPYEVTEWWVPSIVQLTGVFSSAGSAAAFGMKYAEEEINAAGGVNGKPIRVELYDSASDPAQSVQQMARILDQDPVLVMTYASEVESKAVMDQIKSAKVFAINPGPGEICSLAYMPWNVSFITYDVATCGLVDQAWARRESDIKTVVPIYDANLEYYGRCSGMRSEYLAEMGVETLEPVTYDQFAVVDFGSVAIAALAQEPDGFIITSFGDPIAKTIIELYRRGMTDGRKILIHGYGDYAELYSVAAGYLEDVYVGAMYNEDCASERWRRVKAAYDAQTDLPMYLSLELGYDMPYYAKYVIEHSGVTGDPAKLAEERVMIQDTGLNITGFPFVMGDFDVIDGIAMHPMWLSQIDKFNHKVVVEIVPAQVPEEYR